MPTTSLPRRATPAPCLTSAAWGGRLIGVLFALTVAAFVIAVVALG